MASASSRKNVGRRRRVMAVWGSIDNYDIIIDVEGKIFQAGR
jgi:hypothetical protein